MKKFLLNISSWAGDNSWEFEHPTKSKEDFIKDVDFLLKEKAELYFASTEKRWISDTEWLRFIIPFLYEEKGYIEPLQYEGEYCFNEIGIIKESKIENCGLIELQNVVGEDLINRAIELNKKIDMSMKDLRIKKHG